MLNQDVLKAELLFILYYSSSIAVMLMMIDKVFLTQRFLIYIIKDFSILTMYAYLY